MSPTSAFAVLWMAPDGKRSMIDVDGDGPEALQVAERIAVDLAEMGRTHVCVVVTDVERLPQALWEEASARLAKAKVMAQVTQVLQGIAG